MKTYLTSLVVLSALVGGACDDDKGKSSVVPLSKRENQRTLNSTRDRTERKSAEESSAPLREKSEQHKTDSASRRKPNRTKRQSKPRTAEQASVRLDEFDIALTGYGFWARRKDGVWSITRVVAESPAAKHGLEVGTILEQINGKKIKAIDLDQFWNLLPSVDGEESSITMRPPHGSTTTVKLAVASYPAWNLGEVDVWADGAPAIDFSMLGPEAQETAHLIAARKLAGAKLKLENDLLNMPGDAELTLLQAWLKAIEMDPISRSGLAGDEFGGKSPLEECGAMVKAAVELDPDLRDLAAHLFFEVATRAVVDAARSSRSIVQCEPDLSEAAYAHVYGFQSGPFPSLLRYARDFNDQIGKQWIHCLVEARDEYVEKQDYSSALFLYTVIENVYLATDYQQQGEIKYLGTLIRNASKNRPQDLPLLATTFGYFMFQNTTWDSMHESVLDGFAEPLTTLKTQAPAQFEAVYRLRGNFQKSIFAGDMVERAMTPKEAVAHHLNRLFYVHKKQFIEGLGTEFRRGSLLSKLQLGWAKMRDNPFGAVNPNPEYNEFDKRVAGANAWGMGDLAIPLVLKGRLIDLGDGRLVIVENTVSPVSENQAIIGQLSGCHPPTERVIGTKLAKKFGVDGVRFLAMVRKVSERKYAVIDSAAIRLILWFADN